MTTAALSALRPHSPACGSWLIHMRRALIEVDRAFFDLEAFCERVEADWRAEDDQVGHAAWLAAELEKTYAQ